MTKANIKNELQKVLNEYGNDSFNDTTLHELQELNVEYGDGHKWCSWTSCLIGIIKNNKESDSVVYKAFAIYSRHIKNETHSDDMSTIGHIINNI